jgi:hypothetical protein
LIKIFVVVNPELVGETVVRKLTSVISDKHDAGGVNIVVSGPRFADAKAELMEMADIMYTLCADMEVERKFEQQRTGTCRTRYSFSYLEIISI